MAWMILGGYVAALAAYLSRFFKGHQGVGRFAPLLLRLTLVAHGLFIVSMSMANGRLPLCGRGEVLDPLVFAFVLIYLVVERLSGHDEFGWLVLIVACLLYTGAALGLGGIPTPGTALAGPLFTTHVLCAVVAYAGLFLGFLFALSYLVMREQIKRRRLGLLYDRLPSLDTLDTMTLHANALGTGFLTVAIVSGACWAMHVWPAGLFDDIKLVATFVIWILYILGMALRRVPGWNHRRGACLTVVTFAALMFSFLVLGSMPGAHHRF